MGTLVGQTVSHYEILEHLGAGGMGVVYKARDLTLDRTVALKFLPSHISISDEMRGRFLREAKAAAALNHPHICTIHGVESDEENIFIVMEFVEGGTLRDAIPFDAVGEAVRAAIAIGEALEEAHAKGIVHRDIKPDNIMLNSRAQPKVMDFGLAKLRGSLRLTMPSETVGTIAYMAPEQIQGAEADARSDIFSFGVLLFEMLTGRHPFRGEHQAAIMYSILNESPSPITTLRNDVPPSLSKVIVKALEKNPEQRYGTMEEMLGHLRKIGVRAAVENASTPSSIAVLAFGDMSPHKDQDYLCEGLAEELINALTKIKALRVPARTSAFAFKGKQMDIREIGNKLNVETILEGSVQKSGNRLRITAQLINVADGYHLWSERYDREMKDVFEIQDEITTNIVQALRLVLTDREKESIAILKTPEIEAYEFYLRGRRHLSRYSMGNLDAIAMFRSAIEIDPGYALAWCGLADAYSLRYLYWEGTEANRAEAESASRRAVELNPDLAEAHSALGYAVSLRKDYDESDQEFEMAIRCNPRLYDAYYYYARTCFARGDLQKAAILFEDALRVRPEDFQVPAIAAGVYRSLGDREKHLRALRVTRDNVTRHLELNPDDCRAYYLGGMSVYFLGEKEKAEAWFMRAFELEPENVGTYYNVACHYAQAGENDKSIGLLKKAIDLGFSHRDWIEHDPDLDPLRNDPRFRDMLLTMK